MAVNLVAFSPTLASGSSGSITVGAPNDCEVGDYLLAVIIDRATSDGSDAGVAGWTRLAVSSSSAGSRIQIYGGYFGQNGMEATGWVFSGLTSYACSRAIRFTGVDRQNPIGGISVRCNASGTTGTTSITPNSPGCMVIGAFGSTNGNTTWSGETTSGSGTLSEYLDNAYSTYLSIAVGRLVQTNAVATGDSSATMATALNNVAALVALRPEIFFRSRSNPAGGTGSTQIAVDYPSVDKAGVAVATPIVAGDLLVLTVTGKYPDNFPTTPSGWTASPIYSGGHGINTADAGQMFVQAFYHIADGTESGNLTVDIPSGNSVIGKMFCYGKANGVWDIAFAGGPQNSANSATWSVTADSNPGLKTGDLLLVLSGQNTNDGFWTTEAVSATGATFTGMQELLELSSVVGDDIHYVCTEHSVSTGLATVAPTYSATVTLYSQDTPAGATLFMRVRTAGYIGAVSCTLPKLGASAAGLCQDPKFTIVQKVIGGGLGEFSTTVAATQVHSVLLAILFGVNNTSPNPPTVVDNASNEYTLLTSAYSYDTPNNNAVRVYCVSDSVAGATSVTVNSTASAIYFMEIQGADNTAPVDVVGALNTQAASFSPTSPSVTTNGADLVLGILHVNGGYAISAVQSPFILDTAELREYQGAVAHYEQSEPGSAQATFTNGQEQNYCSSIVALKVASSGTTGTGSAGLPRLTASSAGTHTVPNFAGVAAASAKKLTCAATGTSSVPNFAGTASISFKKLTCVASGTRTVPNFTGTVVASTKKLAAVVTGSSTVPNFAGTIAASLKKLTCSAGGASVVGAVASSFSRLSCAASGTRTVPNFAGSATISAKKLSCAASGTRTVPNFAGSAACSLHKLSGSSAGSTTVPNFAGAASSSLRRLSCVSSGAVVVPNFSGSAVASLDKLLCSATGASTVPVSTGEAAVYLKRLVSVASGSSTVPEFTGQIEVAVGHLSCSGSGISVTPEDALIHELSMQFGNAGRMAAVISSAPLLSVEVQRDVLRCDVEE